jgi:hypothetical protein
MAAVVNGCTCQPDVGQMRLLPARCTHLCAKGLHGTCTCGQDAGHLRLAQLLPSAVVGHGHDRAVVHRAKAHQLQCKALHMSMQQVGTCVIMERFLIYRVAQLSMIACCCCGVLQCGEY